MKIFKNSLCMNFLSLLFIKEITEHIRKGLVPISYIMEKYNNQTIEIQIKYCELSNDNQKLLPNLKQDEMVTIRITIPLLLSSDLKGLKITTDNKSFNPHLDVNKDERIEDLIKESVINIKKLGTENIAFSTIDILDRGVDTLHMFKSLFSNWIACLSFIISSIRGLYTSYISKLMELKIVRFKYEKLVTMDNFNGLLNDIKIVIKDEDKIQTEKNIDTNNIPIKIKSRSLATQIKYISDNPDIILPKRNKKKINSENSINENNEEVLEISPEIILNEEEKEEEQINIENNENNEEEEEEEDYDDKNYKDDEEYDAGDHIIEEEDKNEENIEKSNIQRYKKSFTKKEISTDGNCTYKFLYNVKNIQDELFKFLEEKKVDSVIIKLFKYLIKNLSELYKMLCTFDIENYYFDNAKIEKVKEYTKNYITHLHPILTKRRKCPFYLSILKDTIPILLRRHKTLIIFNLEYQELLNNRFNNIWRCFSSKLGGNYNLQNRTWNVLNGDDEIYSTTELENILVVITRYLLKFESTFYPL
jgi:hypothetical protein